MADPLRYLCLTSRLQLETSLDTWWSRMVGTRVIWGPGLEGWDSTTSVDENLRRRFGALTEFDGVVLSDAFTDARAAQPYAPPSPELLGARPTIAFVPHTRDIYEFNFGPRGRSRILDGVDVVLHPYSTAEMDVYLADRTQQILGNAKSRAAQQLFRHLPHHVRTDLFFPPSAGDSGRDIDVLLVGRCHAPLYPLRARWARLISEGQFVNAVHYPAPYGEKWRWSEAEREKHLETYAGLLRRARIVLTCSSHWRYMVGKYTEIAASGAFIIADAASQIPRAFIENMGLVGEMFNRDHHLVDAVNFWLQEVDEREKRAAQLTDLVRKNYAMDAFWMKVDAAVQDWRTGITSAARHA